jgi:hypothetical protein
MKITGICITTEVICGEAAIEALSQKHLVHIAPAPVLAGLKGLHDGMLGLVKVLGGMLVLGRVAAANVTADQTFPQVDPGIAHLQTLFAAFAARFNLADFLYVRTGCLCVRHLSPRECFFVDLCVLCGNEVQMH